MLFHKQPSPWAVQASCLSDVGRVRQNNEDSCLIDLERALFIVSDGIGGHQAGEVASAAVVTVLPPMIEQLAAQVKEPSDEAYEHVLREAILKLSQRLRTESTGSAGLEGLGATVVVAWLFGATAHLAYMGDSRIYLYRQESPQRLKALTEDHSVVALLLRRGEITAEEAQTHPARGQISRYVGMEGDTFPDVQSISLQLYDRLLLCSDGLTGMLSTTEIIDLLEANPESESACKALVEAANAAGGTDNITALVVNCG